jgi:hypothetical protein
VNVVVEVHKVKHMQIGTWVDHRPQRPDELFAFPHLRSPVIDPGVEILLRPGLSLSEDPLVRRLDG